MKYFVTAAGTPTPETICWWPMGADGRRTFANQGGAQEAPTTFDSKEDADRWIGTAFSRMSGGALSDPRPEPYTGRLWMNRATGTVAAYHEWWYENENGDRVNAVDLLEVEEVEWEGANGVNEVDLRGQAVDFDAAVALMDDDIREALHMELAPCTDQEFLDAYAAAHKARFGEDFVVN